MFCRVWPEFPDLFCSNGIFQLLEGARKRALLEVSPLILFLAFFGSRSGSWTALLGSKGCEATLQTGSAGPRHQTLAGIGVDQAVHLAQLDDFLLIVGFADGGAELLDCGAQGSTILAVSHILLLAGDQPLLTTFMVWHLNKPPFGTHRRGNLIGIRDNVKGT